MTLIVEDGTGIPGANSYIDSAWADAYLAVLSAEWGTATPEKKEGALVRSAQYLDGVYGERYRGIRASTAQGLEWPRSGAQGASGEALLGVPHSLRIAAAEAARIALSTELMPSLDRGGLTASENVGGLSVTYQAGAPALTRHTAVEFAIRPLLESFAGVRVIR